MINWAGASTTVTIAPSSNVVKVGLTTEKQQQQQQQQRQTAATSSSSKSPISDAETKSPQLEVRKKLHTFLSSVITCSVCASTVDIS